MQTLVAVALIGVYIVLIGVSTFLEKPVLNGLDPLQLNALVGLGIFIVGGIALLAVDRRVPPVGPIGAGLGVGVMIGVGSIAYFLPMADALTHRGLTVHPVGQLPTRGGSRQAYCGDLSTWQTGQAG